MHVQKRLLVNYIENKGDCPTYTSESFFQEITIVSLRPPPRLTTLLFITPPRRRRLGALSHLHALFLLVVERKRSGREDEQNAGDPQGGSGTG